MPSLDYSKVYKVPRMYMTPMHKKLDERVPISGMPHPDSMILLNDADYWLYYAGKAVEKKLWTVEEDGVLLLSDEKSKRDVNALLKQKPHLTMEDNVTCREVIGTEDEAIEVMENLIDDIFLAIGGNPTSRIYVSNGEKNFRDDLSTVVVYKGERPADSKPKHYYPIKQHLLSYNNVTAVNGIEADDAVAHKGRQSFGKAIICSCDKDLWTVPGWHLNPQKLDAGVVWVTEREACLNFYVSLLTGDRTDNIKGLSGIKGKPGIGDGKARKMLGDCRTELEMLNIVGEAYDTHHVFDTMEWYQGVDRRQAMAEMANLLYLRINPEQKWEVI